MVVLSEANGLGFEPKSSFEFHKNLARSYISNRALIPYGIFSALTPPGPPRGGPPSEP